MGKTGEDRLGTEKVSVLLFRLAVPAVAAQLINVLYNIVDRMYLGHMKGVGDIALTGVGVTFPIIMLISAFSAFVGMGGAPLASIRLGEGDKKGAEKILGNSVSLLIFLAVILTTAFMIFKIPFLYAFGASSNTISYANDYITIYLAGTIFVQAALGLNQFINAQGHAFTAMLSVLIGAVINIILDPVFIFGFHMGVRGAAFATVISQCVSAIWVFGFLLSKKSILKIRKENLKPDGKIIASIAALGISPFIMQSTESLVSIVLNSGLQKYGGDIYVGSMTIITSVLQLIVMPLQGITQGGQPIISYNFGAGKEERVKKTFRLLLITALGYTILMCFLVVIFPGFFVSLFNKKQELVHITKKMMPVFLGGIWAFGAQSACQSTFLALGQARISLFLALLRKVILLIPLALIFPVFFGVNGIYFSEPVADIVASATTLTIFLISIKKILKKGHLSEDYITK